MGWWDRLLGRLRGLETCALLQASFLRCPADAQGRPSRVEDQDQLRDATGLEKRIDHTVGES